MRNKFNVFPSLGDCALPDWHDPWPYPDDGAAQYVNHVALPAAEAGKGWYWTIRRKAEPMQLIGVICLMDLPDNNRGFWLVPSGRGRA
jgi:RimJ/RimL family protein N-acetyltransferase